MTEFVLKLLNWINVIWLFPRQFLLLSALCFSYSVFLCEFCILYVRSVLSCENKWIYPGLFPPLYIGQTPHSPFYPWSGQWSHCQWWIIEYGWMQSNFFCNLLKPIRWNCFAEIVLIKSNLIYHVLVTRSSL